MFAIDELTKLIQHFPEAKNIEYAGKCDSCRVETLWSFQIEPYTAINEQNKELCGYYCASCDFSNAGRREHTDWLPLYPTVVDPQGEILTHGDVL